MYILRGSESIIVIIAAAIQLIPNLILVAGAAPPPPPYPGHRSGCGHPCSRRYVVESSSSPSPPVWLSPTLVAVWGGGLVAVVGHNGGRYVPVGACSSVLRVFVTVGELGWLMYTRGGTLSCTGLRRDGQKKKEAYLLELATSAVGCLSAPCVQSMGGCKVTCEYPLRPRVRAMGGGGGIAFVGKEARKLGLSLPFRTRLPTTVALAIDRCPFSHLFRRRSSVPSLATTQMGDDDADFPQAGPGSLEDRPHVLTPRHFFPWPSDLVASPYLPLSPSLRLSNASGSPPFVFGKARVAVAVGLDVGTVRLIVSYRPFSQLTYFLVSVPIVSAPRSTTPPLSSTGHPCCTRQHSTSPLVPLCRWQQGYGLRRRRHEDGADHDNDHNNIPGKTRTRKSRVRVFPGTGTGSLGRPQGYPLQSLMATAGANANRRRWERALTGERTKRKRERERKREMRGDVLRVPAVGPDFLDDRTAREGETKLD
ncbi:hypothetical protein EDB85DRAFT_1900855 [Lactarius pseudohatsudake]|nr:hypothetical protein EDB85DRAFT_1900855 [Lactarius pseudohatsudake]